MFEMKNHFGRRRTLDAFGKMRGKLAVTIALDQRITDQLFDARRDRIGRKARVSGSRRGFYIHLDRARRMIGARATASSERDERRSYLQDQ